MSSDSPQGESYQDVMETAQAALTTAASQMARLSMSNALIQDVQLYDKIALIERYTGQARHTVRTVESTNRAIGASVDQCLSR